MNRNTGLVLLLALLLIAAPAASYEAWQPASDNSAMDFEEYADILDRFTAALERATAAQAAHPQFLADLQGFQEEFAALLYAWLQTAGSIEGYAAPVPNLTGTYDLVANTFRNTLIIEHRGSVITGKLFNDDIKDGRIESDGSVHFIRSGPNQVYTGTISTTAQGQLRLFGTFDCPVTGGRNLTWEAIRK